MEKGNYGVTADSRETVPVRDYKKVSLETTCTKKKRGAMHFLKEAMFVLSRRWKKLKPEVVGSMQPLRAQTNLSLPHEEVIVPAESWSPQDLFVDVPHSPAIVLVPPSPDHSLTTSEGGTSRYASALNLQELDKIEDSEGTGYGWDNGFGDEMIDLKADEFIARFYEKIQNQNEMDPSSP